MEALDGIRILFTGAADPFQKNLKLTMGAGMTATLPPASLRVGAVGGIFVVSDETKRPDEAAMRRILERYSTASIPLRSIFPLCGSGPKISSL